MKIFIASRFCLLLSLIFVSGYVLAEGFYLGGGISFIRLSSEHPSINDQNGTGYYLFAGTRSDNWGLELAATGGLSFNTGETPGIYYPEDSAEYGILDLGLKRFFHPEKYTNLSPWIGAGLGLHIITWDTYYYEVGGFGYSLSGGLDYRIAADWFVRGGMIYNVFQSDDTYEYGPYDGTSSQLNLILFYQF